MLLPKSSCVCIQCFKSVVPRICLVRVPFLAFLGAWHGNRNGWGHIHALKTSPRLYWFLNIYIWVYVSNSLGSSVLAEIPFLAYLALHREGICVARSLGPSPCYFQSEVVYAYQVLGLKLQGIFWPNTILSYSRYHVSIFQPIILPSFREIHSQVWPE